MTCVPDLTEGGLRDPTMLGPSRLRHLPMFSPDVWKSVAFMPGALGIGLPDRRT